MSHHALLFAILHILPASAIPTSGAIDLEWWQWLGGAVTILGLSPAPWIVALLRGRLLTLTAHAEAMAREETAHKAILKEKDDATARIIEEKNYWRNAAGNDRDRSDRMAEKLMTVTEEFGATTVHLLRALPEAVGNDVERA
jgi:hypothetical protein